MRLPFQREPRDQRGSEPAPLPAERGDEAIAAARTLARRRLVGAVVLLGAGVVGFPMLFETQPRPLPANLPIVTAQGEAAPTATPAVRATPARPGNAAPAASHASPVQEAMAVPPPPSPIAAVQAPAASAPAAQAASAAPVVPAPKPAAMPEPAPTEGRFVVQVGAYSDATMLRETRQKVEKLGLKTYTQVIDGEGGKRTRVRVGPFATRSDAQAAAAKLKAAGLPANLLTL